MRRVTSNGDPKRFNQARRPKFLFSGLTKCAECGGGYVMYWRDRLACFGARSRGTCSNRLMISRQEVEEAGPRGAARQADAPRPVRGLLP
jgi:site-specific DNA recombinase